MNLRDWALVAFTLLVESSAGILLMAAALHLLAPRGTLHETSRALEMPLLAAAGAAALGLLASLAHLGQPAGAWLAISNVRTSWLSREVVLAAAFAASAAFAGLLFRTDAASTSSRTAACVVAAVLGIATVYAMSRVYMVSAQPPWNRLVTPVSFLATTAILGAVVVHIALEGLEPQARWMAAAAIALLVVQVLLLPAQVGALAREPSAAISAASVGSMVGWLAAGRVVATLVAAVLLAIGLRGGAAIPFAPSTIGIAALALVAVSEILGRVLFYASSVHLGPV